MENINPLIKKYGIVYGIKLGLILLTLSIGSYYYITKIAESFFVIAVVAKFVLWLLSMLMIALFCFDFRKKIGGYRNIRQATTGIFIMFIVAYSVQFIGKDILFEKVIDKNVQINTRNAHKNANSKLLKEDADIAHYKERDKKIDEQYPQIQKETTLSEKIVGVLITIIFAFVISFIFGSLFKKEIRLK